jgi:hypothetical protein
MPPLPAGGPVPGLRLFVPDPVEPDPVPAGTVRFHLEEPPFDGSGGAFWFPVSGWVCSTAEPVRGVEVVAGGGACLQGVEGLHPRPDVAATYPDAAGAPSFGFRTWVCTLGLPQGEVELELVAVLASGQRVPVGTFWVRCPAPPVMWEQPAFRPVPVIAFGRSGTTRTLRLLKAHPEVLVPGGHPYELRPLSFWFGQLRSLFQSYSGESPGRYRPWAVMNPFGQPGLTPPPGEGQRMVEAELRHRLTSLDELFRGAAASAGRPAAGWLAEKMIGLPAVQLTEQLYPSARPIVLVRDFRDMFCSIRAFNARRGYPDFGRESVDSEAEHIDFLAGPLEVIRRYWEARRDHIHLLRYEDLVTRPHKALRGLFEYLGVDASPGRVAAAIREADKDAAETCGHRTTASAGDSVGRWERDLEPELCGRIEEKLAGSLTAFGYLKPRLARAA